MIVGKLYKYKNDYVLVVNRIEREGNEVYYALFKDGTVDILTRQVLE